MCTNLSAVRINAPPHFPPPRSIFVGMMVAFVDVELVGFLYWAGLSFNSVTSINLLIAVGVAVDYSAFYAFSFMTKVGTNTERAEKALRAFGVAVFNGGFTLFLAVLPLALSQSYIFQTFFKVNSPHPYATLFFLPMSICP